jgi:quinol monooxygenase YgiN
MITRGLFVELEAARDQETAVERFLEQAVPLVRTEPRTAAWFAVRFRRYHYGIFDVFPDDFARASHLQGPVARALGERASLFARAPEIHAVDILAEKLPATTEHARVRKALFLRVTPHRGRERELAELMRGTRSIVDAEPGTTAWFVMRFENGDLGFFDAFSSNRARIKHLLGKAPRELIKNFRLLGSIPRGGLLDIHAEAFAT